MRKSRLTEDKIIGVLRKQAVGATTAESSPPLWGSDHTDAQEVTLLPRP